MDPDMVRQQEEAEREARGLSVRKSINGAAGTARAPTRSVARGDVYEMPATEFEEVPAVSARKAPNPNRRALPPMGSGRLPGEAPPKRRRVRGLFRLFLYALGGAIIGGGLGWAGVTYYSLFPAAPEFFISSMAGGFALLFGLAHLLHYDH